jgi:hypothetical protein
MQCGFARRLPPRPAARATRTSHLGPARCRPHGLPAGQAPRLTSGSGADCRPAGLRTPLDSAGSESSEFKFASRSSLSRPSAGPDGPCPVRTTGPASTAAQPFARARPGAPPPPARPLRPLLRSLSPPSAGCLGHSRLGGETPRWAQAAGAHGPGPVRVCVGGGGGGPRHGLPLRRRPAGCAWLCHRAPTGGHSESATTGRTRLIQRDTSHPSHGWAGRKCCGHEATWAPLTRCL